MTVEGSCHCGAVRIEVPTAPEWAASCNCSICRRTGALVSYYRPEEVRVEGETATYITGDRFIRFHSCPACHCHTHWSPNPEALAGDLPEDVRAILDERMGINARLLDGFELRDGRYLIDGRELEIRFFDNADR
jgi:hypothetical protein